MRTSPVSTLTRLAIAVLATAGLATAAAVADTDDTHWQPGPSVAVLADGTCDTHWRCGG